MNDLINLSKLSARSNQHSEHPPLAPTSIPIPTLRDPTALATSSPSRRYFMALRDICWHK